MFFRLAFVLVLVGCTNLSTIPGIRPSRAAEQPTDDRIKHVVIVIQENRTFDNLFWGYPGADSTTACALDHLGRCVPMVEAPLYQQYDLSHSPVVCARDQDGGKNDGFDLAPTAARKAIKWAYEPYQYTQPSDIQAYWAMAQQYVLADRMFQSNCGPSFPAHQMLIAGTMGYADNPTKPWGCDNYSFTKARICYDYDTLGDALDRAGLSWRYYTNGGNNVKNTSIWLAYQAVRHIRFGTDWTNGDIAKSAQFFTDAASGALPAVTWITPTGVNSDHPGDGGFGTKTTDLGPAWVASIVDAVGSGPDWSSTVVFITWDDWGGWYDHVQSPVIDSNGDGFRVPLLVVSPFARHGYVSHEQHEFGSILRFVEANWSLPTLGARDSTSDDLMDCFDFGQQPSVFRPFAHVPYDRSDTSAPDDD